MSALRANPSGGPAALVPLPARACQGGRYSLTSYGPTVMNRSHVQPRRPLREAGRRRYGIWKNAGESGEFHTFHPSTVREVGADGGGAAAPDRGLQGLLQELGLSQLALPLIKAMGPHNLEDQMQYTQLNTRVVDSLDVRGIP